MTYRLRRTYATALFQLHICNFLMAYRLYYMWRSGPLYPWAISVELLCPFMLIVVCICVPACIFSFCLSVCAIPVSNISKISKICTSTYLLPHFCIFYSQSCRNHYILSHWKLTGGLQQINSLTKFYTWKNDDILHEREDLEDDREEGVLEHGIFCLHWRVNGNDKQEMVWNRFKLRL